MDTRQEEEERATALCHHLNVVGKNPEGGTEEYWSTAKLEHSYYSWSSDVLAYSLLSLH